MQKKTSTDERLKDLDMEERRSEMLAWLEDDPMKKAEAVRRTKKLRKIKEIIRKVTGGRIETKVSRLEWPENNLSKN